MILIVADALRADALSCYAGPAGRTPRLDEFAQGAALFENAVSAAAFTFPSFSSIFTSLYPEVHGTFPALDGDNYFVLSSSFVTLAEVLRGQGYATAAFDNLDLAGWNWIQGFEKRETGESFAEVLPAAQDFVRGAAPPFFMFLHFIDVHHPYVAPARYSRYEGPYRPLSATAAVRALERLPDAAAVQKAAEEDVLSLVDLFVFELTGGYMKKPPIEARLKHVLEDLKGQEAVSAWFRAHPGDERLVFLKDAYEADVRYADERLGTLFDALRARGFLENSLVVFTADHGEHLGEDGNFTHGGSCRPELLHVPLLVHFPGGEWSGRRVAAQVRSIDIFPTVLDALDLPVSPRVQGETLTACLMTGAPRDRPAMGAAWGQLAWLSPPEELLVENTEPWGGPQAVVTLHDISRRPGEFYAFRDVERPASAERLLVELSSERARCRALRRRWLGTDQIPTKRVTESWNDRMRDLGYLK